MPQHHSDIIDLTKLEQLSRTELRALWTEELGKKPPPSLGRDVLALGIAYARQEQRYGGLTKSVARELDRLLARALGDGAAGGPQTLPAQLPRPGTILVRQWQG